MAVYHDARCRLCRREGMKLFLKGQRCFSDKCAFERRGYAPGEHGKSRRIKETNYGQQLREKQKARRIYGLLERQFRHTFGKAALAKGVTGDVLMQMLERRLDNVVFRLGLAPSRNAARQLVRHGHMTVNGLRERSRKLAVVLSSLEARRGQGVPEWMELNTERMAGRVRSIPTRASIPVPIKEQLIVELYSK